MLLFLWLFFYFIGMTVSFDYPNDCDSDRYQNLKNLAQSGKLKGSEGQNMDEGNSVAKIFQSLETSNAKLIFNITAGMKSPCYVWKCTNSRYKKLTCRYCLPYVMLAGFSKCGSSKLVHSLKEHPLLKEYNGKKEIQFFTHGADNLTVFEDLMDAHRVSWKDMMRYWIDGTIEAAESHQAISTLFHYSPDTKILFIVRDPYQRLGSYYSMIHRSEMEFKDLTSMAFRKWLNEKFQNDRKSFAKKNPFLSSTVNTSVDNLLSFQWMREKYGYVVSTFLAAEIMISWKGLFSDLMVVDQFDLLHYTTDLLFEVETFLGLPHHKYPKSVANEVINDLGKGLKYEGHLKRPPSLIDDEEAHKYLFFKETQNLLDEWFLPSSCLFFWVFGKPIHMITPL